MSSKPNSSVLSAHPPRSTRNNVVNAIVASVASRTNADQDGNDRAEGQARADRCTKALIKPYFMSGIQRDQLDGNLLMLNWDLARKSNGKIKHDYSAMREEARHSRGYTYSTAYPVKDTALAIADWTRALLNPAEWIPLIYERSPAPVTAQTFIDARRDAEQHLHRCFVTGSAFKHLTDEQNKLFQPAVYRVMPPRALGGCSPMVADPRNMFPCLPGLSILRECVTYLPPDRLRPGGYLPLVYEPAETDKQGLDGALVYPYLDDTRGGAPVFCPKAVSTWTMAGPSEKKKEEEEERDEDDAKSELSHGSSIYLPASQPDLSRASFASWPVHAAVTLRGARTAITLGPYQQGVYARTLLYMIHRYGGVDESDGPTPKVEKINPRMFAIDDVMPDVDTLVRMLLQPRTWFEYYMEIMNCHLTGVINPFFWAPNSSNIAFARAHWPHRTKSKPQIAKSSSRRHHTTLTRMKPSFIPFEIKQKVTGDMFMVREHYLTTDTILSASALQDLYGDPAIEIMDQWEKTQLEQHPLRRKDLVDQA